MSAIENGTKKGAMPSVHRLHIRLHSCLQAILDLEPELKTLQAAEPLLTEFSVLKEIYNRLDTLSLREEDVRRIEMATSNFFEEIKGSIRQEAAMQSEQRFLQ
jgi:hypothetical protein